MSKIKETAESRIENTKVSLDLLFAQNVKWKKIHGTLTERKSDGKIGNSLSEKEV